MKITRIQKNAFLSAVVFGFLAYGYMITNKITSNDDIGFLYGSGGGIYNGRWMLWVYDQFFQMINSPWSNGLLFIFLLAASAMIIVDLFDIKNSLAAVAIGAAWMVFPSNISTLFYMFTAVPYAVGIVLSISAAYIAGKKKGFLASQVSVVCIVLSLGCYQAYYSATAGVLLIVLLQYVFQKDVLPQQIMKKAVYFLGILVEGMLGYLFIQKVLVLVFQIEVTDYNNLSTMGLLNLNELFHQVERAYENSFHFWESISSSSRFFKAVDIVICLLLIIVFLCSVIKFVYKKNYFKLLFAILLFLIFPIACSLVYLYGASGVHTLMCLGNFCPILLLLCTADQINLMKVTARQKICTVQIICILSMILSLYNCILSSRVYLQQEYIVNASIQYLSTLVSQIKSVEDYEAGLPVAFVGICSDPGIQDIDNLYIQTNLVGENTMQHVINIATNYDWCKAMFFQKFIGFSADFVDSNSCEQLKEDFRIQNMPTYPNAGSVQKMDRMIVVRFS